jgi:hypothetical protein
MVLSNSSEGDGTQAGAFRLNIPAKPRRRSAQSGIHCGDINFRESPSLLTASEMHC